MGNLCFWLISVCSWYAVHSASPDVALSKLASLPLLRIDPAGISCSGISSGADFALQFQVAFRYLNGFDLILKLTIFSDLLMGVGVYAGEPYHCAVTRFTFVHAWKCLRSFRNDELQHCQDQPASQLGPGCTSNYAAPCEGCPPNTTLIYDHCKIHPEVGAYFGNLTS